MLGAQFGRLKCLKNAYDNKKWSFLVSGGNGTEALQYSKVETVENLLKWT